MMRLSSTRALNTLGFFICLALTISSFYLEFVLNIQPCPLCIIQRFIFVAIGILFLIGLLLRNSIPLRIQSFGVLLLALTGGAFAGRQVWLQHQPHSLIPACGPGLSYLIKELPFKDAMSALLRGSGDCALVQWTLLKYSLAQWSLIFFAVLGLFGLINLFRKQ